MAAPNAIAAPPVQPPRYGLIVAAPVVDDASWRWGEGFTFDPEACAPGGVVDITACGSFGDPIDPQRGPANVDGDPFVVWAGDECSSFGYGARDWQGRARRALEAGQSFAMAHELWTGDLGDSAGLANTALADLTSDTLTAGPDDPVDALACLDQGLATVLRGRRGMIHMTVQAFTHLAASQALVRDGALWTTPIGSVVVADAGYTGSGPGDVAAATSQWMYGTSMLSLRLGPVETVGGPEDASGFAHSDNTVQVWAFRPVAFVWDECAHVAAEVDIAVCALDGVS